MKYNSILYVDDDPDDIALFTDAVRIISQDIECITFSDPVIALQQLESRQLRPDIIFLDLQMGVHDGRELLSQIRNTGDIRDIPVILLSTHSADAIRAQSISFGAGGFITKPTSFTELVDLIRGVLAH